MGLPAPSSTIGSLETTNASTQTIDIDESTSTPDTDGASIETSNHLGSTSQLAMSTPSQELTEIPDLATTEYKTVIRHYTVAFTSPYPLEFTQEPWSPTSTQESSQITDKVNGNTQHAEVSTAENGTNDNKEETGGLIILTYTLLCYIIPTWLNIIIDVIEYQNESPLHIVYQCKSQFVFGGGKKKRSSVCLNCYWTPTIQECLCKYNILCVCIFICSEYPIPFSYLNTS